MAKTKLTLYVDKEIIEKAKKLSKNTGSSISSIISDFIYKQYAQSGDFKISEKVEKWVGAADPSFRDNYKSLRDKTYEEKLKRYESSP